VSNEKISFDDRGNWARRDQRARANVDDLAGARTLGIGCTVGINRTDDLCSANRFSRDAAACASRIEIRSARRTRSTLAEWNSRDRRRAS
jgi:hypothetical protein